VSERVRFVGFRDDVENVYGAADVIAVPSTAPDPLPGSAVEAAAAGCAIVAAAHGGLPEIIRDGVSGRLVTPGDPVALARALVELIDDPAARAARRRRGAGCPSPVRPGFAARFDPAALRLDLSGLAEADAAGGEPGLAGDGDRAHDAQHGHQHATH
jgi:glycosyltransferase involved in cell wall biosynthesis